jgi:hypothetical protein
MKWQGRRQSSNVEDRRGQRGAGGGRGMPMVPIGGGLGLIIMVILFFLQGGLGGGTQPAQQQPANLPTSAGRKYLHYGAGCRQRSGLSGKAGQTGVSGADRRQCAYQRLGCKHARCHGNRRRRYSHNGKRRCAFSHHRIGRSRAGSYRSLKSIQKQEVLNASLFYTHCLPVQALAAAAMAILVATAVTYAFCASTISSGKPSDAIHAAI